MFKARHSTLLFISGLIWLIIGCILLPLGLNFVVESILIENFHVGSRPVLDFIAPFSGGVDQAALLLIACALGIGFLKGKYVFSKSVDRGVKRILTFPNPESVLKIYSGPYLILLGSMFFLGFIVKFLPLDIRGGVDVIIGSALINGSVLYFRRAWTLRAEEAEKCLARCRQRKD